MPQEQDDMSGLHLLKEDGAVTVYAVDLGSPAYQAGIKAGDEILSRDEKRAIELKMQEIRDHPETAGWERDQGCSQPEWQKLFYDLEAEIIYLMPAGDVNPFKEMFKFVILTEPILHLHAIGI